LSPLVLVGNQRRDIGLDASRSQTDDNNGHHEATKTGAAVESSRNGSASEDDETDNVDAAEDDNGVVLSKVLIGNDSTKNRSDVAPELEKGRETSGSLMTHAQGSTA
jgi:hypothetical protein